MIRFFAGSRSTTRGASIVEFVLAIPFVMLALVAIVDLSRYVATRAVLTRGAQAALEAAIRERNFELQIYANNDTKWTNYTAALARVRQAGLKVVTGSIVRPSSAGNGVYAKLKSTTLKVGTAQYAASNSDIMVLRPGDTATIDGQTINYVPIPTGETYMGALRTVPIAVEIRATIQLMTPLMGKLEVRSRAFGYRELPKGKIQEFAEADNIGCGNGIFEPGLGESCDGEEGCSWDCRMVVCGDGIRVEPTEQCDPSVYSSNQAIWHKYCYPPGHAKACKAVPSTRENCSAQPEYDPSNGAPTIGCCGDSRQQTQESCETGPAPVCDAGICSECSPDACIMTCSGGSCPEGYTLAYTGNGPSRCECVQDGSVIN